VKTIEISVKSNYLPGWGFWEGVREIIQNALDAGIKKIAYDSQTKTLTIEDTGSGFSTEAFLIGYTTKASDNKTIGQFGEGLKFGSLALVRSGYPVVITSQGKTYIPTITKSKYFNSNVLAFQVEKDGTRENGTEVKVQNVSLGEWDLIRERILILNENYDPLKEILMEDEYKGKIYYRGIFVREMKNSLWGYNFNDLTINRDREIIDDYSLKRAVGKAIAGVDSLSIIHNFVKNLQDQDVLESSAIIHAWDIPKENVELWKEAWKLVFGDNAVVETDESLREEVEYFGYKVVRVPWGCKEMLKELVRSDEDVINRIKEFQWEDKGPIDIKRYPTFKKVYIGLGKPAPVHWFRIKLNNPFAKAYAMSKKGTIYLDKKLSLDEISMIEALVHEVVHVRYGLSDNTPEFNQVYGEVWKDALKAVISK